MFTICAVFLLYMTHSYCCRYVADRGVQGEKNTGKQCIQSPILYAQLPHTSYYYIYTPIPHSYPYSYPILTSTLTPYSLTPYSHPIPGEPVQEGGGPGIPPHAHTQQIKMVADIPLSQ